MTSDELVTHVAERLARYKRVRTVQFIEKVPRSAAGKILRRQLPALAAASELVER